jgi:hypothetical protein
MFICSDYTDNPDIVPWRQEETGPTRLVRLIEPGPPTPRFGGGPRDPPVAQSTAQAEPPYRPGRSDLQARLTGELEALRQCREWLERLDRGERVVVNLRPETDPETEYVAFDRPLVLRVLARIIADLDDLAGNPSIVEEEATQREDAEARRVRHRRRLVEPDPPPKRLSVQEERAALWDALGLPRHKRGEVSTAGRRIGTRLSSTRDSLQKGPLNETRRSQFFRCSGK